MKKLETITTTEYKVTEVVCNGCGKPIPQDKYGHRADCLSVDKEWGYGSCFDGENHSFDLCDECYSEIISNTSQVYRTGNFIPVSKCDSHCREKSERKQGGPLSP